ncbi:MAG: tRNA (guanosine(46)-N7)-methyltransferase TrmB [Bacilli bacterium]
MRVRHKPWARDYLTSLPFHIAADAFDFAKFKASHHGPIAIEIGVGKGDYLKAMAEKYPEITFFGIEINASVLAVAAQKIEVSSLRNIFICNADALILMPKFPSETIDYVILNHSDPWPKKRHEKRRLTYPLFLKEYYRILKKDAHLLFKTDNDDFAHYSYEMMNEGGYKEVTFDLDYRGGNAFDAKTEYETKFALKGVNIKRIVARK